MSSPEQSLAPAPRVGQAAPGHAKHLWVLACAQILSGLGNGAGLALGALLASDLGGTEALGGTVSVAISLAGMLVAIPLARLAVNRGRRFALTSGYLTGAVGAFGMIFAAGIRSYPLLLVAAALLGVAAATNLQARFAATDGSGEGRRARDLSMVVWALTIGAVVGPSLAGPGANVAAALGLPVSAGAFIFSAIGLVLAAALVFVGLRPDPLAGRAAMPGASKPSLAAGIAALRGAPGSGVGVAVVAAGHACMVAVMSMTTIHLTHVHHQVAGQPPSAHVLTLVGLTLSGHIAGMYAFSPLVGWAVDRMGPRASLLTAQAIFAASAILCLIKPEDQTVVSIALFVLGVAWSFSSIGGSAVVTELVPQGQRIAAQGLTDACMSAGGVLAGLGSGVLLEVLGYRGLNAASLTLAALMAAVILVRVRPRGGVSAAQKTA